MNAVVQPNQPGQPVAFDFSKAKPAGGFAVLNPQSESLADGIGQSYGVIGYKGKVFSLRLQGTTHYVVRQDDGTAMTYIDAIILRQARVKAKSFYEGKFDPASNNEGKRPQCSSIDGIRPDADAQAKQAEACGICPRNVFRTNAEGKKEKECTDYKRMAILLLPKTVMNPPLPNPHIEPTFLRVPPDSLNDLAVFGETMANQGWHFSSFITRISFDPQKAHPKFQYRAIGPLSDAEATLILKLREDPVALRITGEDMSEAVRNGATGHPALPAPATQQQVAQLAAQPPTVAGPQQVVQQPQQPQQQAAPPAAPPPVVQQVLQAIQQPAPPVQQAAPPVQQATNVEILPPIQQPVQGVQQPVQQPILELQANAVQEPAGIGLVEAAAAQPVQQAAPPVQQPATEAEPADASLDDAIKALLAS